MQQVFCLVEAPNAEAAERVHREAHGLTAGKIIEIDPEMDDGLLGGMGINDAGAAIIPETGQRDNAVRGIMFTDIVGSTELAQRLGDDISFELVNTHDVVVRAAVPARQVLIDC